MKLLGCLVTATIVLFPANARADLGVALGVVQGMPVVLFGLVAPVPLEAFTIWAQERHASFGELLWDLFLANGVTALVGGPLAFGMVVAGVGYELAALLGPSPGDRGVFLSWVALSFVSTAYVEAWILGRRWKRRGELVVRSALHHSFLANAVSHVALAALTFLVGDSA